MLTLRYLLGEMGIPFVEVHLPHPPDWLLHNDTPTCGTAQLGKDIRTGQWLVVGVRQRAQPIRMRTSHRLFCNYADEILHEACHLLVGDSSLEEELGLMALQWVLIQRLLPFYRNLCRASFADYGLTKQNVGQDDSFLDSEDWLEAVDKAKEHGILGSRGDPQVYGVHPSWEGTSKDGWILGAPKDQNDWRRLQIRPPCRRAVIPT